MGYVKIRRKVGDALSCVCLLAVASGLVIFPSQMVSAAKDGVDMCFNVIIPSLFPFFVLSSLTVELGVAEKLGRLLAPLMRPLFNVGGACASALVLGFIGGYPVGAKTVINLYENGECSKTEAERMLSFCNNSGPAFIFGVVGAGIFSSGTIGLILYLAHIAASVCVGLVFRRWGSGGITRHEASIPRATTPFPEAFVTSVRSSFMSALGICGFVIFFTVLIKLLFISGIMVFIAEALGGALSFLGINSQWVSRLLTGLIELTSGVWSLREVSGQVAASVAMAAFMLGWAGLSVHCQVLSFIGNSGISVRTYVIGKFLHGVISAVLVFLIVKAIAFDAPVAVYLAEQLGHIAQMRFTTSLRISSAAAAALGAFLLIISLLPIKNSGKSVRKDV